MGLDVASVLARLLPSLGLIVGGLLLLRWWTRRAGGRPGVAAMRVTSRAALGRQAAAAVLHVEGRRFLVGLTDNNVSLIAELAPETTEDAPEDVALDLSTPSTSSTTSMDLHPRTGLVDRLQRATARRPVDPSWRRVDRVLPG